eukprot:729249-Amorphochlora_amoeboformis.AAC.1
MGFARARVTLRVRVRALGSDFSACLSPRALIHRLYDHVMARTTSVDIVGSFSWCREHLGLGLGSDYSACLSPRTIDSVR